MHVIERAHMFMDRDDYLIIWWKINIKEYRRALLLSVIFGFLTYILSARASNHSSSIIDSATCFNLYIYRGIGFFNWARSSRPQSFWVFLISIVSVSSCGVKLTMGGKECAKLSLVLWVLLGVCMREGSAQLSEKFYQNSCPNVEGIVRNVVNQKFSQTFVTVPGTLRLFFHDCFVEGCDASVIIQSTATNTAEKDFQDNLSLAGDGFDTVIKAKQAVENACPNTVSCADILTIAARDVVAVAGGPSFKVELGRRDGMISQAARVPGNLPKASFDLNKLYSLFHRKGLSMVDMIALSGAHTLGFSHCNQFANRIYSNPIDPTLNRQYASQLQGMCPRNVDPTIAINMDPTTSQTFDNAYYTNLQNGKGLFTSDEVLFTDNRSKGTVNMFASNPNAFNTAFTDAMRKLGRVGVKTGNQGEIRKDCSRFN